MPDLRSVYTAAALWAAASLTASAAPLIASTYEMRNGNGQASGGSFNYWDLAYSGSGLTTGDGAPLTGGLGDLTDGVVATDNWFTVENAGGTGPYVGWCRGCGPASVPDPTITFRFTPGSLETYVFDAVTLYLDDSNNSGGVEPPASVGISVNGGPSFETIVTDPASGAPFVLTIGLAGTPGDVVEIQLRHDSQWIFLSEVAFDGRIIIRDDFGVPEPGALALLGAACAGLALSRRGARPGCRQRLQTAG